MSPLYAAPTISGGTECAPVHLYNESQSPGDAGRFRSSDLTGPAFAGTAKELFSPPDDAEKSDTSANTAIKVLPPLPGAILMTFSGFLCVTFVKDRRFWVAALATLIWAGQFGMLTLPRLAFTKTRKSLHNLQTHHKLDPSSLLQISSRPRSDIEGTRYIGLLHHLEGMPDARKISLTNTGSRKNTDRYRNSPAIITPEISLTPPSDCLAAKAWQIIHFSPAFIFALIPRGPPEPDRNDAFFGKGFSAQNPSIRKLIVTL